MTKNANTVQYHISIDTYIHSIKLYTINEPNQSRVKNELKTATLKFFSCIVQYSRYEEEMDRDTVSYLVGCHWNCWSHMCSIEWEAEGRWVDQNACDHGALFCTFCCIGGIAEYVCWSCCGSKLSTDTSCTWTQIYMGESKESVNMTVTIKKVKLISESS